jgi:GntR family transcriptional regulator/MocR family aminotransferase
MPTNSNQPLFTSLANDLIEQIESGKLRTGDSLPSTRQLAEQLGLSRGTVRKAYQTLAERGYTSARQGSRTTVSKAQASGHSGSYAGGTWEAAPHMQTAEPQAEITAEMWRTAGCHPLPIKDWRSLSMRYLQGNKDDFLKIDEHKALYDLKTAISQFLLRQQNVQCDPSQVMLFPSRESAISQFCDNVLHKGSVVGIEEPTDITARNILLNQGLSLIALPIDRNGIDPRNLKNLPANCTAVFVSPNSHYPLGCSMTQERRTHLIAKVTSNQSMFILEEANEFASCGLPRWHSLHQDCPSAPIFFLFSFGKLLSPLTNLSVMVIPKGFRECFPNSDERNAITALDAATLHDLLASRATDRFLTRQMRWLTKARQMLYFSLTMRLGRSIQISPDPSPSHLVVKLNGAWSEDSIKHAAAAADLDLLSSRGFYSGAYPENEYLISFRIAKPEEVEQKVQAFAQRLTGRPEDMPDRQDPAIDNLVLVDDEKRFTSADHIFVDDDEAVAQAEETLAQNERGLGDSAKARVTGSQAFANDAQVNFA